MGTSPWTTSYQAKQGDSYPATNMSIKEAIAFCERLSEVTGETFRLPTQHEWECAARAGSTDQYHFGSDPQLLTHYAWYSEPTHEGGYLRHPNQVATKKPNKWGLYDMCGNVWEYAHNPDSSTSSRYGQYTKHGGAFNSYHSSVTVDQQSRTYLDSKDYDTGFRIVRVK